MKIAIAADHGGFHLKTAVADRLRDLGHEVEDLGVFSDESSDYPEQALPVARRVADGLCELGVLICGSGIGMSITANRVHGVRAVLAPTTEHARLGRAHNNGNLLCMGERLTPEDEAFAILDMFLATPFEGGRHQRRIGKIDSLTQE